MRRVYLLLLICALFSACKKKNTDIPDVSTFFARLNGYNASISNQNPKFGTAAYIAVNDSVAPDTSNGVYTSILQGRNFKISISKAILVFKGYGAPSTSTFQEFFNAAGIPYIESTNTNGIAVEYFDKDGVSWNSALGQQDESVFTITKSQPSGNDVKIQAEFNCTLFNGAGDSLLLTGGMFTGLFKAQ